MKIGGFQGLSTIDFPATISSVIYTQGCNFKCPYCHNHQLIPIIPDNITHMVFDIFTKLEQKIGLVDGIVITGGEPTIQKDIINFCRHIKQMGFEVKIDTNGSNPKVLEELIQIIDYIAMDIKSFNYDGYKLLSPGFNPDNLNKSIDIIMQNTIPYEFRMTAAWPFINIQDTNYDLLEYIHNGRVCYLQVANSNPNWSNGRPYSSEEMEMIKSIISDYFVEVFVR